MKNNIENLFKLGISNYKISKDTGVAESTLSNLVKGVTKIGTMKLDTAIKLNEYYIKTKNNKELMSVLNNFGISRKGVDLDALSSELNKFDEWQHIVDEELSAELVEGLIVKLSKNNAITKVDNLASLDYGDWSDVLRNTLLEMVVSYQTEDPHKAQALN